MTEEVEETTEESHSGLTEASQRELSEKEYVCSVCGATVVPEEHDTSRGVRYRCPECGNS